MADYVSKYTGEEIDEAVGKALNGSTGLPTGGAAHQMLVTDADGNALWEDRTHYIEYTDVVVLEETTLGVDETEGMAILMTAPAEDPTPGGKYDVVWNGTTYACVGTALDSEGGSTWVALGNMGAMEEGADDTGEPFLLVFFDAASVASMGFYGMFVPLDGSAIITLSITGQSATVHQLDELFLSAKNTNIVNGTQGSLRQRHAAEEDDEYTLGDDSVAFGCATKASGVNAFASGNSTVASGTYSRAGGYGTVASGVHSYAEGFYTTASGMYSCVEGRYTIAASNTQHVQGRYNIEDTKNKYAHIVGNGSNTARSNAHTLDWDGNAWFAGDVYIGGTSQDDAKKLATVEDVEAAAGGSTAVPAYVRTEAETVARLVNWHQSNDSIIFPFLADAHCGYYKDTANDATTLAGQLLNLIGQRVPYDFIVNGGDMANGAWDTTRALSFDQIEDYTELTSDAHRGVPAIWVPGNHDDAPYMATADRVTQKEMFALIGRKNRQSGAICPNGCNYGYLDLESQHLRVIYLDTDDKRGWGTVQVGNGETAPAYLNAHNIGGDQLRWLAETALDFSGKDAADWSVVVVSHVALDVSGTYTDVVSGTSYANSTANAASVLSSYASGGSGSITHNGITVPYDYSALDARATVICCVHGHGHKFVNGTVSGILSIGCPNVMNGRERESSDGTTYTKTAGTAEGTSFCIMTIDRENHKVYADCVGVGPDREFEYTTEVMPYTNLLPISTDADGAVYNGKGYKENTYLSSGNDGTKTGIYASGYIQGVANEYGNYFFYCKNVGMQTGQDSHRVALYDGTKTYITTVKTTVTGNPFTYGDDGNISQLMFTGASYPDGLYIRICCGYLGDDSVITANEPIE